MGQPVAPGVPQAQPAQWLRALLPLHVVVGALCALSGLLPARRFLALLRRLRLQATVNDVSHDIWGMLSKPKEVKARNRRLIELAEYMKQFLAPEIKQQDNVECVCVCVCVGGPEH